MTNENNTILQSCNPAILQSCMHTINQSINQPTNQSTSTRRISIVMIVIDWLIDINTIINIEVIHCLFHMLQDGATFHPSSATASVSHNNGVGCSCILYSFILSSVSNYWLKQRSNGHAAWSGRQCDPTRPAVWPGSHHRVTRKVKCASAASGTQQGMNRQVQVRRGNCDWIWQINGNLKVMINLSLNIDCNPTCMTNLQ